MPSLDVSRYNLSGTKGASCLLGKSMGLGSIDSAKSDQYILPRIQALVETHPRLTYMQDNAPAHLSLLTA